MIDKLIKFKIKLTPKTHDPCLYYGKFKGKLVLFLQQVDAFAVATEDNETCQAVISAIDEKFSFDIKDLGQLT